MSDIKKITIPEYEKNIGSIDMRRGSILCIGKNTIAQCIVE